MKKGTAIVGFILSFIAGAMLMWGIDRGAGGHITKDDEVAHSTGSRTVNPGAAKVELFVMSQCPYGVQVVNAFEDVVKKLGPDLDLKIDFIGQKSPSGELTSMHGPKEVKGNIAQLCAEKIAPDKYMSFLMCQNKNMREVDANWDPCSKETGIPTDKLKACIEGQEGQQLLAASFDKAQQKGARGSPTIFLNGQKYEGGRRTNDFLRAICGTYKAKKPAACESIPESPKVNVTVLTDKRCAECDTRRQEGMIRSRIANPVLSKLDYSEPAGKKLFDEIGPIQLPAIVFDSSLDADKEASMMFSRGAQQQGSYKVLTQGANWNPVCADEGGCEKEECKPTLQCREEEPNKLEVFVMSQCPFGVKGLNAMEEVLKNFDNKIDFEIHFIGNGDAETGLKSMHGQAEVDENIREICAIKHYPKNYKYMEYILCRNKNIKSTEWESCATNGIDAAVIKKCFEGDEGKQLLEKSYNYSQALGFGASPTWLANGKYKFSGIDAETIKTNFCKNNKLDACANKLSGNSGAPAPGGCGG